MSEPRSELPIVAMGGCIKALFGYSRREEVGEPLHASPDHDHYSVLACGLCSSDTVQVITSAKVRDRRSSLASRPGESKRSSVSLADINSANYHQLCVLASISHDQAEAIVNHRVRVYGGRFSHFEQLLDIPGGGITPEKLEFMGVLKASSSGSLATNKLTPSTSHKPLTSRKQDEVEQPQNMISHSAHIDFINSANYHQLSVLARISTHEAEAIVAYKVEKCGGKFSTIEQLMSVPGGGIECENLQFIKKSHAVCCKYKIKCHPSSPNVKQNQQRPTHLVVSSDQIACHLPTGLLHTEEVKKHTPSKSKHVGSLIRIGSWNLECFTIKKVSNAGVLEVICMTILMNG